MALKAPARALVLMDQRVVADTIVLTLNHGVFAAQTVPRLSEAATLIAAWHPRLVVIDMDLGDGDLLSQLGLIRSDQGPATPVLALTRRGDLKTKLAAFEQGVDDIMTVPFSPEELLARALAITRRAYGEAPAFQPTITIGEIEIDILNRVVRAGSSAVHLTALEQSLLYLLAANAGRVLTRDEILDTLWGVDFVAESNVVDRHIRSLRAKLQNDWRRPRLIATVPGRGYRFVPFYSSEMTAAST